MATLRRTPAIKDSIKRSSQKVFHTSTSATWDNKNQQKFDIRHEMMSFMLNAISNQYENHKKIPSEVLNKFSSQQTNNPTMLQNYIETDEYNEETDALLFTKFFNFLRGEEEKIERRHPEKSHITKRQTISNENPTRTPLSSLKRQSLANSTCDPYPVRPSSLSILESKVTSENPRKEPTKLSRRPHVLRRKFL
ncbi:hypothetical protein G9A89_002198 [Geosiphon pyriformis]|nr:hypothetical protein G9A89_002198 [Geosiphon pyriformis]